MRAKEEILEQQLATCIDDLIYTHVSIVDTATGAIDCGTQIQIFFNATQKFLTEDERNNYVQWLKEADHKVLKFQFAITSREGLIQELVDNKWNLPIEEHLKQARLLHEKMCKTLGEICDFANDAEMVFSLIVGDFESLVHENEEEQ